MEDDSTAGTLALKIYRFAKLIDVFGVDTSVLAGYPISTVNSDGQIEWKVNFTALVAHLEESNVLAMLNYFGPWTLDEGSNKSSPNLFSIVDFSKKKMHPTGGNVEYVQQIGTVKVVLYDAYETVDVKVTKVPLTAEDLRAQVNMIKYHKERIRDLEDADEKNEYKFNLKAKAPLEVINPPSTQEEGDEEEL